MQHDTTLSINAIEAYKTSGVLSLPGELRYIYRFYSKHSLYIEPWISQGISALNSPSLNYSVRMLRGGLRVGYRIQV